MAYFVWLFCSLSTPAPQKLQGKAAFLLKGPFAIFFGGTEILTGLSDEVPLMLILNIESLLLNISYTSDCLTLYSKWITMPMLSFADRD